MSTIEIAICDRCKKEIGKKKDAKTITIFLGRWMDGAPSSEDHYDYVDLCIDCIAESYRNICSTFQSNSEIQFNNFLYEIFKKSCHNCSSKFFNMFIDKLRNLGVKGQAISDILKRNKYA